MHVSVVTLILLLSVPVLKDKRYLTPVEAEYAEVFGGFAFILVLCEIAVLLLADVNTYRSQLSATWKLMTQWFAALNWRNNRDVNNVA